MNEGSGSAAARAPTAPGRIHISFEQGHRHGGGHGQVIVLVDLARAGSERAAHDEPHDHLGASLPPSRMKSSSDMRASRSGSRSIRSRNSRSQLSLLNPARSPIIWWESPPVPTTATLRSSG